MAMPYSARFVLANHPNIQYFGWWDRADPLNPRHSWPGVYIQIKFTGTRIGIRLGDNIHYYNVTIDGKLHTVLTAQNRTSEIIGLQTI